MSQARYECVEDNLPYPWTAVIDPGSGDKYYWNEMTDEVAWDRPKFDEAKVKNLPPGWEAVPDAASGDTYYWNVETDEVTWDFPSGPARQASAAAAPSPAKAAAAPETRMPENAAAAKAAKRKPRGVIMAESYAEELANFKLKKFPKSDTSRALIRKFLEGDSFMFASLAGEEREQVVDAMEEKHVAAGEELIKQNDPGDYFYIVESGDFDIFVGEHKVASRGAGSSFGEKALMYNCPRAATVRAVGGSALVWALDRLTFRYMLMQNQEDKRATTVQSLKKVSQLKPLTDEQFKKVAEAVQTMIFQPNDVIIKKGEQGDTVYIMQKGKVVCTDLPGDDVVLHENNVFGERAILMSEPRAATVIALEQTTCLILDRKTFNDVLGPLREVMDKNICVNVLASIPLLKDADLNDNEKDELADKFTSISFSAGDDILVVGVPNDKLFSLKNGKVRVSVDGQESELATGAYFGESGLVDTAKDLQKLTVSAVTDVVCDVLTKSAFEATVGSLKDLISKTKTGERHREPEAVAPSKAPAAANGGGAAAVKPADVAGYNPKGIAFSDLEIMQVLGSGTFGLVKLVRHVPTNSPYALKILQKAQVCALRQQKNVMNEKNIMARMNHPFILKLAATFKDDQLLYMLLELVQGGELFSLLANQETGCVPPAQAKFYGACVVSALAHMHQDNILYRDLKPENMLIDAQGYIKIVDMGFAKQTKDRTYTLCGTPEYLAPELVLGKGHHKGVDYWAVGVLIYEMLCGFSPFADFENNDQMVIFRNIVNAKLEFPKFMRDKDAKSLITKLLNRSDVQRYGCRKNGAKDIVDHRWFRDIKWDQLIRKDLQAPWIPPLKDPFDTSCFDADEEPQDQFPPYKDDGTGWDAAF